MFWHARHDQNGHVAASHKQRAHHLLCRYLGPTTLRLLPSAIACVTQTGEGIHAFLVVCTQNPAETGACNRNLHRNRHMHSSFTTEARLQLSGEDQHNNANQKKNYVPKAGF